MAEALDAALKQRVRAVLEQQPVTEAELRRLTEEGRACQLILNAQLARAEDELARLSSDPASSLGEMAAALRNVNELRPDLDELGTLLSELEERARSFRASWLAPR